MKYLIIIFITMFAGCSSNTKSIPDENFIPVEFEQLSSSLESYRGKKVMFDAFVLGSEYNPSEEGRQFFVLSLSNEWTKEYKNQGGLFVPEVSKKLRAAEDGYNKEVIVHCYKMADNARKLGQKVTFFAECKPNKPFYYYGSGVHLYISKMKFGEQTVNTDYADKSEMAAKAPGYVKSVYQGGKKLFDLAKKLKP